MLMWANPFDPFPFRLPSVKRLRGGPWYFTAVWVVNQPHNGAIQRPSNIQDPTSTIRRPTIQLGPIEPPLLLLWQTSRWLKTLNCWALENWMSIKVAKRKWGVRGSWIVVGQLHASFSIRFAYLTVIPTIPEYPDNFYACPGNGIALKSATAAQTTITESKAKTTAAQHHNHHHSNNRNESNKF